VVNCPLPTASFTVNDNSICEGECISITNTSTDGTSFSWTFSGGNPSSSSSQNPGTVCYPTAGNYTISLTVTNATGSATSTENIVVSSAPTVTASGDTTVDLGNSVPITAVGSGSGTYSWTPTSGITCITCASTTVLPQTSSYYVVEYTEGGCTVSDSVYINVNIIEAIEVPNAFSPNGDSNNDVLYVLGQGIYSLHLKIYNRYGQLVFESMDQADGWDGTHNGKDANSGVFAYTLEYTLSSGSVLSKKGNITLVR
jgi:gliding motility-associated-like protein